MFIKKLHLKNFRSHRDTAFDLSRLVVIRGLNGSGKSSIQMAIEYALTNRNAVTDARGAGAEELITLGAKELGVQLKLDGGAIVTRVRQRSGGSLIVGDGKQGFSGKVAEQWVEQYIAPLPILSAVLNSSHFIEMSQKEQAALLAGALAAEPIPVDPAIMKLEKSIGCDFHEEIRDAAAVDSRYKFHYDKRTETNRDLKSLGEIAPPDIPADAPPLEKVRARIAELQTKRDASVSKRAHLFSDADSKRREYEKAQQDIEELGANILTTDELKAIEHCESDQIKAAALDKEIATLEGKLTPLRERLAKLEKNGSALPADQVEKLKAEVGGRTVESIGEALATIAGTVMALDAAAKRSRSILKQINESNAGECPTCAQAISEEHAAQLEHDANLNEGMIAEKEELRKQLVTLQESARKLAAHNAASGEGEPLRAEIAKFEVSLAAKKESREKLGDPDQAVERLKAHRKAQIDCTKAEKLVAAGAPPEPDTSKLDEEIGALDARIAKGNSISDQVSKFAGAQEQYEKQLGRQKALQQQLEVLEKLIEYFGPKGSLKAKLVGGRLPAFRDRINEVLRRFGFACHFELEPYSIHVGEYREIAGSISNSRSLNQLSESEAYRFGIAFQVALAEATKVGFVIIDRADMLTASARNSLTGALLESGLDQVLILSTGEPLDELPEIPDTAFYELQNEGGITSIRTSQVNEAEVVNA
jgi:DNA repair exonuclease SbcCD ATPase subunit